MIPRKDDQTPATSRLRKGDVYKEITLDFDNLYS